jgi:hypothetical protein
MSDPSGTRDPLEAALRRAELAESKARALEGELERVKEWRRALVIAVVAVALLAILMLGIVAFNATDNAQSLMLRAGA